MLARMLGLFLVVVVLVVGMESLQVISWLDVLRHVLNTRVGRVVALRWREGTVHGLPFVVFILLELERVGSLIVVDRCDDLVCANPTLEQMARHWLYSFGTNPSAESFVHSCVRFGISCWRLEERLVD
jgi:hypothetical protein